MKKILYSFIILTIILAPSFVIGTVPQAHAQVQPSGAQLQSCAMRNGGTTTQGYHDCVAKISQAINNPSSGVVCATSGFCPAAWINDIEIWLGNFLLRVSSQIVYASAYLLNYAVYFTVLTMAQFLAQFAAVPIAWAALRNVANILFIFILIWIAVSTILSLNSGASYRKLATVIIIALLINFSLFFTKVIIDVSNVVALQFFNAASGAAPDNADHKAGIGVMLISRLNLQTIYGFKDAQARAAALAGNAPAFDPSNPAFGSNQPSAVTSSGAEVQLSGATILLIGILGSIFMFIASFVFFIAAILLFVRLAVLIILMITSPLAYVGMLLPRATSYANQWWSELFSQAIFAPVLMMLLWVIVMITSDPAFLGCIYTNTVGTSCTGSGPRAGLLDAITFNGSVAAVMQFGVVIIFLMAALIIAKKMGSYGGGTMIKLGSAAVFGTAGFIGRNTAGRASSSFANTNFAKNMAARSGLAGLYGKTQLAVLQKGAQGSFDARGSRALGAVASATGTQVGKASGKGGYEAILKRQTTKEVKFADTLGSGMFYGKDGKDADIKKKFEDSKTARDAAKENVEKLNDEIKEAKDAGMSKGDIAEMNTRRKAAKLDLSTRKKELEAMRKSREVRTRRQAYADNLEKTRDYRVAWAKVPRKYKDAAQKIRKEKSREDQLKGIVEGIEKEKPKPAEE